MYEAPVHGYATMTKVGLFTKLLTSGVLYYLGIFLHCVAALDGIEHRETGHAVGVTLKTFIWIKKNGGSEGQGNQTCYTIMTSFCINFVVCIRLPSAT